MEDGLADLAGGAVDLAVDAADVFGTVVDVHPRRKRWKGCLILLVLMILVTLLIHFLAR